MSTSDEFSSLIAGINKAVGNDWNSPRSRMYIAATLETANRRAEKSEIDLGMEKSVNQRVLELLKETFVERLARSTLENGERS